MYYFIRKGAEFMIEQLGKNKYKFIVNIQTENGRVRKTKRIECNGKREANRLYAEFEREVKADHLSTSRNLKEAMDSYIENGKLNQLSANTIKGYNTAKTRIISFLTDKKMDKVTSVDIEHLIAYMQNNKRYAPKTIKNTITFLSQVYEREIRIGKVQENPCNEAKMPKLKAKKVVTVPQDELSHYIDGLQALDLDTKVAFELALFCGMRRSEILGLREADVSLERNTVIVQKTRHRVENKDIEQDTKTVRSRRVLSLPSFLADDVKSLMELHNSYDFETTDYIIQNGFGEPLNPSALTSRSIRYCKHIGIEPVSIHKLRHTYASMLINSRQADIIQISTELGHSNTTTTLNIYGHLTEDASVSSRRISSIVENFATFSATSDK